LFGTKLERVRDTALTVKEVECSSENTKDVMEC